MLGSYFPSCVDYWKAGMNWRNRIRRALGMKYKIPLLYPVDNMDCTVNTIGGTVRIHGIGRLAEWEYAGYWVRLRRRSRA